MKSPAGQKAAQMSMNEMTTDELVERRYVVRMKVKRLENIGAMRTLEQRMELLELRRELRGLMTEAGRRFLQFRLL